MKKDKEKNMEAMDLLDYIDSATANHDLVKLGIEVSQQLNGIHLSESATRGLGVLLSYISSSKKD